MEINSFRIVELNIIFNICAIFIIFACIYAINHLEMSKKGRQLLSNTYIVAVSTIGLLAIGLWVNGLSGVVLFYVNYTVKWLAYLCSIALVYAYTEMVEFQFEFFCGEALAFGDVRIGTIIDHLNKGFLVLLLITPFTKSVFFFDGNNVFHKGKLYGAIMLYVIAVALILMVKIVSIWNKAPRKFRNELVSDLMILIISVIIQWMFGGLATICIAITGISIHYMLLQMENESFVLVQKEEMLIKQREQLQEATAQIMLSQIQPHFLYNTLNTIYYLCGTDSKTAHKAIRAFSDYLRANLNSLNDKELIPLEQEMHHVETYLWIEKMRFEERLNIDIDIQIQNIMIPVLIIQPIAENAVKHGLCNKADGGTIHIHAEEDEAEYRVIVEDDGIGFDPKMYQTEVAGHTGVYNVKKRLETHGASLEFFSEKNKGTKAVIHLPKKSFSKATNSNAQNE